MISQNLPFKLARIKAGFTQRRLAHVLGISEAMVCRYEPGRTIPSENLQNRIAQVLSTSLESVSPLVNS